MIIMLVCKYVILDLICIFVVQKRKKQFFSNQPKPL